MPGPATVHRLPHPLRRATACLPCLLLGAVLACDRAQGSAPGSPPLPPPAWLAGAWTGTFAGTGDVVHALILPSGACRLLNQDKLGQVAGTLALGGSALGGSGSFFLPGALRVPSQGASAPFRFQGSAAESPAPAVRMVLVNAAHSWDMATLQLAPDPAAAVPPRLPALAGSYTCTQTSAGVTAGLELKADGSFSGRDEHGTFTGTLTQPDPAANALRVTLAYTLAGLRSPLVFTGLAYARAQAEAAVSLVLMTDAGPDQYSGIFEPGRAPLP
jgi:hypothetical protein